MEQLKRCPFCGGEAEVFKASELGDSSLSSDRFTVKCRSCFCEVGLYSDSARAIERWNTRKPMERYEELESKLQSVYGECDGLLEMVVDGLVKHEGVEFEKPMRARLLIDEDVDKWDKLKGAMERIVERLRKELKLADEEKERCMTDNISTQYYSAKGYVNGIGTAIEIVKEEI